ncbi:homing endonuclease associated repeat-containing protein, partial [Francisella salimarina]|uniref:homing endonuclease associated repeat-containing protein n=1 Tax=Francisella salimarina TaxID=2599927 RepID=UPI003750C3A2
MDFTINVAKKKNSDDDLIQDVRDVAKKLKKSTITISDYEKYGKYHPSTLQRRFGS